MRVTLAVLCLPLLSACASEYGPPRDPGEPMTSRHLNTSMECSEWQHNADGSWTAVKDLPLATPNGGPIQLPAGTTVRQGSYIQGVDVGYALGLECGGH